MPFEWLHAALSIESLRLADAFLCRRRRPSKSNLKFASPLPLPRNGKQKAAAEETTHQRWTTQLQHQRQTKHHTTSCRHHHQRHLHLLSRPATAPIACHRDRKAAPPAAAAAAAGPAAAPPPAGVGAFDRAEWERQLKVGDLVDGRFEGVDSSKPAGALYWYVCQILDATETDVEVRLLHWGAI